MTISVTEISVSVTCGITLSVLINVASVRRAVQRCEVGLERIECRLADIDRRLDRQPSVLDYIEAVPEASTDVIPVSAEAVPMASTDVIPVDAEIKAWYDSLVTNPSAVPPPRVQKILQENLAESVREYRRLEQEARR